jgi:HK97 family phage major capsid protein
MDYNLKKDYEKLAKLDADQRAIIDAAELEGRKTLNETEEKTFDSLHKEAMEVQSFIEKKEKLNAQSKSIITSNEEIADLTKKSVNQIEDEKKSYNRALLNYLLKGNEMSNEDRQILQRAQSTTNSEGGYAIQTDLVNQVIKSMVAYGGVREVAKIMTTAQGNPLNFVTNNDTANYAVLLAEATAAGAQDTTLGQKVLNAYKYTSKYILASNEILQDSSFDFEAFLIENLAERFGRGLNLAYTTANGSSAPNGLNYAVSSTGVTLADQDAITYSEVLDLKHSVDPAYRANAVFMMNDATLLKLKKLTIGSGDSRPLWDAGSIVNGVPSTIDGTRYVINQDMDGTGSLKTPMFYGDFSKFVIRDVAGMNIRRSTEFKFLEDQTAFVGFFRTDCELMDTAAIKKMRTLTLT